MSKIENIIREKTEVADEVRSEVENEASRLKGAASRVVQQGKTTAQRWGRQGLHAAEGVAGNAKDHIINDPVRSAIISFLLGVGVGALISWCSSRNHQDHAQSIE